MDKEHLEAIKNRCKDVYENSTKLLVHIASVQLIIEEDIPMLVNRIEELERKLKK